MQDKHKSAARAANVQAGQIDPSGKVVLVTGGGRGIGATISLVLAQAGAEESSITTPARKSRIGYRVKSRRQAGALRP